MLYNVSKHILYVALAIKIIVIFTKLYMYGYRNHSQSLNATTKSYLVFKINNVG